MFYFEVQETAKADIPVSDHKNELVDFKIKKSWASCGECRNTLGVTEKSEYEGGECIVCQFRCSLK